MKSWPLLVSVLVVTLFVEPCDAEPRKIGRQELLDKLTGFWVGQLVGNYMGFPFENVYVDEPIPFLVDRYYTFRDDPAIRMNRDDHRSYLPILAGAFEGAYSDDDTDIEFVTLHAVEKHGLDLNYAEITAMWKKHINRKIWVANRTARNLMDEGLVAPATGSKENNRNWFQIDPQLVNEIWSAFYPGMTGQAAARAEWGARITNDDWGTHATVAYAVIYSGAFFEKNVDKLVAMATDAVPNEGPFAEGIRDVTRWHKQHPDWRDTRQKIHAKYYRYKQGSYEAPVSVVSSLQNGLCGIMAMLYGQGDFTETVGIAVSAGYDCDNQASTCGGLMGVLNGADCIPDALTKECLFGNRKWNKPFNDRYINFSRDGLPIDNRISDLVQRTAAIAEEAILAGSGKKIDEDGKVVYVVNCDF
jgi:ADP-ribosylglycohydrolase